MTSIPRDSVPASPRREVLDRPLPEGLALRGTTGFEDFLFPLVETAAQAPPAAEAREESRLSKTRKDSSDKSDEPRKEGVKKTAEPEDSSESHQAESTASSVRPIVSKRSSSRREEPEQIEVSALEIGLNVTPIPVSVEAATETPIAAQEELVPAAAITPEDAAASVPLPPSPTGPALEETRVLLPETPSEAPVETAPVTQEVGLTEPALVTPTVNPKKSDDKSVAKDRQAVKGFDGTDPVRPHPKPQVLEQPAAPVAASKMPATEVEPKGEGKKSRDDAGTRGPKLLDADALALSQVAPSPIIDRFAIPAGMEPAPIDIAPLVPTAPDPITAGGREPALLASTSAPSNNAVVANSPTLTTVSTPTTTSSPPTSISSSRWLQAGEYRRFLHRMDRAFELADQRGGEIRLRLSPPRLGSIRLEMRMQDERMTARIETDSDEAKKLLIEQLPVLRERLAERGISVESFDVETRREGESALMDRRDDGRQQNSHRQNKSEPPRAIAEGPGSIVSRMNRNGNRVSGLDLIV